MGRKSWLELNARLVRMEEQLKVCEGLLREILAGRKGQGAEEAPGDDKWLQDGLASILGYQPGGKKGEQ